MRGLLRMAFLPVAAAATACISPHGAVTADVDPQGWMSNAPAQVVFENRDTLCLYDIHVILRHDCSAGEGALPLRVTTLTPDSLTLAETICVPVSTPVRRRAGMLESKTVYRTGAVLGRTGRYIFTISPAPGTGFVRGITAAGLEFSTTDGKR